MRWLSNKASDWLCRGDTTLVFLLYFLLQISHLKVDAVLTRRHVVPCLLSDTTSVTCPFLEFDNHKKEIKWGKTFCLVFTVSHPIKPFLPVQSLPLVLHSHSPVPLTGFWLHSESTGLVNQHKALHTFINHMHYQSYFMLSA